MDITLETQLVMLTFIHICHIHMHILNCLMCIFKIKRATYLLPSHVPLCYLIDTFCLKWHNTLTCLTRLTLSYMSKGIGQWWGRKEVRWSWSSIQKYIIRKIMFEPDGLLHSPSPNTGTRPVNSILYSGLLDNNSRVVSSVSFPTCPALKSTASICSLDVGCYK